jgi:predicted type IV restriction endonuclease
MPQAVVLQQRPFSPEVQPTEAVMGKQPEQDANTSDIVTTEEEIQAFMIVRAIAARLIDVERVTIRDAKSYCSVFVDDNNRKPVCRFYFNAKSVRHIGLFDAQKVEDRRQIEGLTDLYKYSKQIEDVISSYL